MDTRVGLWRKLNAEELMLLNCVLEKTLESPLDCKEIQPVHSKGDQPWCSLEGMMLKLKPVLWPPHAKSWLIGKDSDAGRDWGQEEKGTTEDEMAGWHHWLDGREFEWTLGVADGQTGLACCDSWGYQESDTTEWLNWTELNWTFQVRERKYSILAPSSNPTPFMKMKITILQSTCEVHSPEADSLKGRLGNIEFFLIFTPHLTSILLKDYL